MLHRGDRGSSIERTEVDLRARVHLEQPPGERLRRPRQFAVRLKLARKLPSLLRTQRLSSFYFYDLVRRSKITNESARWLN
jgi:hypothetical protein